MITTFKTQISLKPGINQDDVWKTIKAWRLSSRNTPAQIKEELEKYNTAPENRTFSDTYSKIQTKLLNNEECKYWGFNLTEKESNSDRIWNTYIILTMNNDQNILTFETVLDGIATKIPYNKPKYFETFITPLIDANSSNIISSAISTDKTSSSTKFLIEVLNGNRLPEVPLVYISIDENGEYLIDPEKLATKLYCVATVFKERDRHFSYFLKEKTKSRNVFNGAIGIYWGQQKRFYFLPEEDISIDKIYLKIIEITALKSFSQGASWFDLQQIETAQKQEKLKLDYENLKNDTAVTVQKLEKQISEKDNEQDELKREYQNFKNNTAEKVQNLESQISEKDTEIRRLKDELNKIENEHKKYIETFDSEVINLENENKELKAENNDLREKNQALSSNFSQKQDKEQGLILEVFCDEKQLFPDEIHDFIKGIFYNAIIQENAAENSRKEHVLNGIKKYIQDWTFEKSRSFKHYESCEKEWRAAITKKHNAKNIIAILEKHHFTAAESPNHYKLIYCRDRRYIVSIAKTESDKCSNKNTINDTRKVCFLIPEKK